MALDLSQLADYSWADIAKAAKTAMVTAALGGSTYQINGRNFGRITIEEAKALYAFAIAQVNAETEIGQGAALVQFGDSQ